MNDGTNMSAAAPPRSSKSAPIGNCSATAAQGGESPAEIGARADRVVSRVRAVGLHRWIQAQPRRAGYPAVERHPSSG